MTHKYLASALAALALSTAAEGAPPHLETQGTTQNLIVDGRPFVILGGELGNSSAAYMKPHCPAPCGDEPEHRDRAGLLGARLVRRREVRLVVGRRTCPSWVKRDPQCFPRAQIADRSSVEILSAFGATTREVEARAFAALDPLGFSRFSIKSLDGAPNALSQAYAVLRQLSPLLIEARGFGRLGGFLATIEEDRSIIDSPVKKTPGSIELSVTFIDPAS